MLHKNSASPLCDWQVKIFIFLTVYLTGSGSILDYIGLCEEIEGIERLPLVNEGSFVMADSEGYQLAGRKFEIFQEWNEYKKEKKYEEKRECFEIQKEFLDAKKLYGVKMTDRQRKQLRMHFDKSVRRLEKLLGRDLAELWF